jgi:hypothetical protein
MEHVKEQVMDFVLSITLLFVQCRSLCFVLNLFQIFVSTKNAKWKNMILSFETQTQTNLIVRTQVFNIIVQT